MRYTVKRFAVLLMRLIGEQGQFFEDDFTDINVTSGSITPLIVMTMMMLTKVSKTLTMVRMMVASCPTR